MWRAAWLAVVAAIAPHYLGATTQTNPRTNKHDQFVSLVVSGGKVRDIDIQVREDCGGGSLYPDSYALRGPYALDPTGRFTAHFSGVAQTLTLAGRVAGGRVTGTFSSRFTIRDSVCTSTNVGFTARPAHPLVYRGRTSQGHHAQLLVLQGRIDELAVDVRVHCPHFGDFPHTIRLDDIPLKRGGTFTWGWQPGQGPFGPAAQVSGRVGERTATGVVDQFFIANAAHPHGTTHCTPARVTFALSR